MRRPAADRLENHRLAHAPYLAVTLISAALIAYEVVLMRRLLVERWHHFGYLVISVALLGFGASGTLLALLERRVRARPVRTMQRCVFALVAALLVMPRLATLLPVSARFIPDDLWNQVGWWSLYWVAALLPFLIGATFLGAALMTAGWRVGHVYAANLFGSGAGAAGAVLIISRFALEYALWPSIILTVIAAVQLWYRQFEGRPLKRHVLLGVAAMLTVVALGVDASMPLRPAYDEHKYAARLQHLVAQGSARRIARRADLRGSVELYESASFHELPFLALAEAPPPMYSLVINGDPAGSMLRINDAAEARVMDGTLMAFPYRLTGPGPRVLLLGETGGANVWLALRQSAARVGVVQPNAAVVDLLRLDGQVLNEARVDVYVQDPRHFLAASDHPPCELIQVVSLEGLGVGSTGMRGLAEDHLATVEGFGACLRVLSGDGLLAISRGIQQPARENIRIFATLVEALESIGVTDPSRHLVQVRDYLGVCTIATRAPLSEARRRALRAAISEFNLTPVWYEGLPIGEVNQPDAQDGPAGTHVDWLHQAAREILSPSRAQFYESWLLNVRPTHDDSPFFWDFYKPGAVAELKEHYGDLWLTRAELGRLFLYASLLIAGGAAVVLILMPLGVAELRRRKPDPGAQATGAMNRRATLQMVVYFGGIGLGFMAIEMSLISRAIHWLGDPVIASASVIGGLLVISGVGSLTAGSLVRDRTWLAPAVVALAAGLLRLAGWHTLGGEPATPWLLLLLGLAAACSMGMPMPAGLAALDRSAPRLVPWAWGVNGVASVVATSVAIVVAMTAGYATVMILAVGAYALAALAAAVPNPSGDTASGKTGATGNQTCRRAGNP